MSRTSLVLSCEHGGVRVPKPYAAYFHGHDDLLASHRGWDPGSLELARRLTRRLAAPLVAATTTRLLIDLNRSVGNPALFSELVACLNGDERASLIDSLHRPHWNAVAETVNEAPAGRVVHLGIHTFSPRLAGKLRTADVALLYDPRRQHERRFCDRWLKLLTAALPELRLRRNYPYRGTSDGITTALRRRFHDERYLGIELEVNQSFPLTHDARWSRLQFAIASTLSDALHASMAYFR